MRSWRVWLGSFWAHVEIMWCHCGHLGRTWGTWRAILEDLEQQEAKRGQQEAKSESKSENWCSKKGRQGATRGDEGRQGATRVWVGGVGAANGGYRGKLLEFLQRIQHALTMLKHGVPDIEWLRHCRRPLTRAPEEHFAFTSIGCLGLWGFGSLGKRPSLSVRIFREN